MKISVRRASAAALEREHHMADVSQKTAVLFDLDGTLTDPGVGITNSVMYALHAYGIAAEREALYRFIGPPLTDSFEQFYGFSHEKAVEAVEIYREYYRKTGIFENSVYAGIRALLAALRQAGKTVIMATSKPEVFAVQIAERFALTPFFHVIAGSCLNGERVHKDEVIRYALARVGIDPSDAVMVGDREYDLRGAHACGMQAVGVLYGYGSQAELSAAGADAIAPDVRSLRRILLAASASSDAAAK